jgi:hypothetical protein
MLIHLKTYLYIFIAIIYSIDEINFLKYIQKIKLHSFLSLFLILYKLMNHHINFI